MNFGGESEREVSFPKNFPLLHLKKFCESYKQRSSRGSAAFLAWRKKRRFGLFQDFKTTRLQDSKIPRFKIEDSCVVACGLLFLAGFGGSLSFLVIPGRIWRLVAFNSAL